MFGFNFAPNGWAFCDGQLLPISQNTALFSLLGTFYGGDGRTTFALPNLQDSAATHQGTSTASGTDYFVGEQSGVPYVTLITTEMPVHTHIPVAAAPGAAGSNLPDPTGNTWGSVGTQRPAPNFYQSGSPNVTMSPQAISPTGNSLPHNNLMPYLVMNFCISLQGVFPARN